MVAPAGIEPATLGLEVLCSDPTELRSHGAIIPYLIVLLNYQVLQVSYYLFGVKACDIINLINLKK